MSLIKCNACQSDIATTAKSCPKCGAINTWIHPQIKRFVENKSKFEIAASYETTNNKICFHYPSAPLWKVQWHLMPICILWILSLLIHIPNWSAFISGGLGLLIEVLVTISTYVLFALLLSGSIIRILLVGQKAPGKTYEIDFSVDPPKISSNDIAFWKDIDLFFKNIQ